MPQSHQTPLHLRKQAKSHVFIYFFNEISRAVNFKVLLLVITTTILLLLGHRALLNATNRQ